MIIEGNNGNVTQNPERVVLSVCLDNITLSGFLSVGVPLCCYNHVTLSGLFWFFSILLSSATIPLNNVVINYKYYSSHKPSGYLFPKGKVAARL